MRIVAASTGSFLCPPGHPSHSFGIEDGPQRDPNLIASLDYAVDADNADWVPAKIRDEAQRLLDTATLVESDEWLIKVYRHFRHCYSPDGVNRNASDALIVKSDDAAPPVDHHLGVMFVRKYFPQHQPRLDLL